MSGLYERFTDRARRVMHLGGLEAQRCGHEYLGTEHILLGLVKEGSGVAAHALKNFAVELGKIRAAVDTVIKSSKPDGGPIIVGRRPHTPRAKEAIENAIIETSQLSHKYVGTEHLLLGLLRQPDNLATVILREMGVDPDALRAEVLELLGKKVADPQPTVPAPVDAVRVVRVGFKPPVVEFQTLSLGEVFLNEHGIWKKVEPFRYQVEGCPAVLANAVGLSGGVVGIATPDDPVTPVECTLTVRPKSK